jgi:hypothetical protein
MRVLGGRHTVAEFHEHLDNFAPGGAEITPQKVGAFDVAQAHIQ